MAQPGDVFISVGAGHAWLVVDLGSGKLGITAVYTNGRPQRWKVEPLEHMNIGDEWTLHAVEHVAFTYAPTERR